MNRAQRRANGIFGNAKDMRRARQVLLSMSTIPIRCINHRCDNLLLVSFNEINDAYSFCNALRGADWDVGEEEGDMPGTCHYVPFCSNCKKQSIEGEWPVLSTDEVQFDNEDENDNEEE